MKRSIIGLAALLAGCSAAPVYRPGALMSETPFAVQVAVLPFKDATGAVSSVKNIWNLSKQGDWNFGVGAVTPEAQALFFSRELDASGYFESARLVYSASDAANEKILIEGTVVESIMDATRSTIHASFAIELTAKSHPDGAVIWTQTARIQDAPPTEYRIGQNSQTFDIMTIKSAGSGYKGYMGALLQKMYRGLIKDLADSGAVAGQFNPKAAPPPQ